MILYYMSSFKFYDPTFIAIFEIYSLDFSYSNSIHWLRASITILTNETILKTLLENNLGLWLILKNNKLLYNPKRF